jgi:dihydrofolate synthase / folylpolyglutamate synthase
VKPGVPVVIGSLPDAARRVFSTICEERGSPLWAPPALVHEESAEGWTFRTPHGAIGPVRLGLEGSHQGVNALVSVAAVHRLREAGFDVPDAVLGRALGSAFIAGRIEWLAPGLVADGAHNPDGTRALADWLAARTKPGRRVLVFGMGEDRDPREVLAPLVAHVDAIVTARCAHPRARSPSELARLVAGLHPRVTAGGDIEDVLPEVVADADETVVAGSLFLAGAARSLVREGRLRGLRPAVADRPGSAA